MSHRLDPLGRQPFPQSYFDPANETPSFSSSPGQQPPSIRLIQPSSPLQNRTISVRPTDKTEDSYTRFFGRGHFNYFAHNKERLTLRYANQKPNCYEVFKHNRSQNRQPNANTRYVTGVLAITCPAENPNHKILKFLLPLEKGTCLIKPCDPFPVGMIFKSLKELEAGLGGIRSILNSPGKQMRKKNAAARISPLHSCPTSVSDKRRKSEKTQSPPREKPQMNDLEPLPSDFGDLSGEDLPDSWPS